MQTTILICVALLSVAGLTEAQKTTIVETPWPTTTPFATETVTASPLIAPAPGDGDAEADSEDGDSDSEHFGVPVSTSACRDQEYAITCDVFSEMGLCFSDISKYGVDGKNLTTVQSACPKSCGCCDNPTDGSCLCDNDQTIASYLSQYGISTCKQLLAIWFVSCDTPYLSSMLQQLCPCECPSSYATPTTTPEPTSEPTWAPTSEPTPTEPILL
eukprot:c2948_g1_i1.p1 GENE.c2948_g1_i1~~c2948_g1_i1.p1  ORF type:complete len:225 (+),score=54.62 c2948_g1_i1:33-677(+)